MPIQSGMASFPYGVTDITTGTACSAAGRKMLAIKRTPSRIETGTSWSNLIPPSIRVDLVQ
jgi:hypothetical protein